MIFTDIEQYRSYLSEEAKKTASVMLSADELLDSDPCGSNPDRKPQSIAVLGNFDGVHRGHAALIKHALRLKIIFPQYRITVWTFRNLQKSGGYLTSPEKKAELLEKLGADAVILDSFDRVSSLSPTQFVETVLKNELNAQIVICGYNYKFGNRAEGSAQMLNQLCTAFGISCSVIKEVFAKETDNIFEDRNEKEKKKALPDGANQLSVGTSLPENPFISGGSGNPVGGSFGNGFAGSFGGGFGGSFDNSLGGGFGEDFDSQLIRISSSDIRSALAVGNVRLAGIMLGRPFSIEAEILHGRHAGTDTLQIPTVNQRFPDGSVRIANGVYATFCIIDGKSYPSVTDIGRHPTFGEGDEDLLETHIISENCRDTLYGKTVTVFFLERLRDEKCFDSLQELSEEIRRNIDSAVEICEGYGIR